MVAWLVNVSLPRGSWTLVLLMPRPLLPAAGSPVRQATSLLFYLTNRFILRPWGEGVTEASYPAGADRGGTSRGLGH